MASNEEIQWHIAKRRAAFRKQLQSYILVNLFFWGLWWLDGRRAFGSPFLPWPVWISFWWGIGLAFSYANAYWVNQSQAIEKEYEKLKHNPNQ